MTKLKKGLLTLCLSFVLIFAGVEGGVPFFLIPGFVGLIAGACMIGWNLFDLGKKSSEPAKPTPNPAPPKPTLQPMPEPIRPVGEFCQYCGEKL